MTLTCDGTSSPTNLRKNSLPESVNAESLNSKFTLLFDHSSILVEPLDIQLCWQQLNPQAININIIHAYLTIKPYNNIPYKPDK